MIADFTSAYLIKRDTLADIKPSFKEDTDIVPPSPHEPAFCNCKKAVKRDVEESWPRLFGQRPAGFKWIPAGLC
ncbi:hypothetical protein [Bradyrhizobium barranii]